MADERVPITWKVEKPLAALIDDVCEELGYTRADYLRFLVTGHIGPLRPGRVTEEMKRLKRTGGQRRLYPAADPDADAAGAEILRLRQALGITQKEASEVTRVGIYYYELAERGRIAANDPLYQGIVSRVTAVLKRELEAQQATQQGTA